MFIYLFFRLEDRNKEIELYKNRMINEYEESNTQLSALLDKKNEKEKQLELHIKELMNKLDEVNKKLLTNQSEGNNSVEMSLSPFKLSPSAEMITKDTSYNLTDILYKLHQKENEINDYKNQIEQRDTYIKTIREKIEKKFPAIQIRNSDYKRCQEKAITLQKQYEELYNETIKQKEEYNNLEHKYKDLENVFEATKKILVDRDEELSRMKSSSSLQQPNNNNSDNNNTSSPDISIQMDILQKENTRLNLELQTVQNNLKLEYEANMKEKEKDLSFKLCDYIKQMESLQQDREHQQKILDSLTSQRDLFKALYYEEQSKNNGKNNRLSGKSLNDSSNSIVENDDGNNNNDEMGDKEVIEQLQQQLNEIRTAYEDTKILKEQLEQDLETIKEEHQKTIKSIQNDCDKYRNDYYEISLQRDQLKSEHDCVDTKYKLLEDTNVSLKNEILNLQKKNSEVYIYNYLYSIII